jgi:phage N-6-adenine-methyltransferase
MSTRAKAHQAYGFKPPMAYVPATWDDEQATHKSLTQYLIQQGSGGSTYRYDEEVADYIRALLELGRAAPSKDEAPYWPRLPFELWRFGSPSLQHINADGQPSLWLKAPIRDRVEYAHQQAILQSRSDEWFTPDDLIQRAHVVMGGIDLDPASDPIANRTVKATWFYTKAMDGLNLTLPWKGRVWLNPPYGRGPQSAGAFVERLAAEYLSGSVMEAIVCLNLNSMSSEWFRPLHDAASAHGIVYGRPSFVPPTGIVDSSPTKGTVLVYLGKQPENFARAYSDLCAIYTKYCTGSIPLEIGA